MRLIGNRECSRKVKYRTVDIAYKHLRKIRTDKDSENPRALNVYLCKTCGKFHIGHKPAQFSK